MKLTVITINYNNKEGLQKTIDSVINQTYVNFEYIIIDGGSTDGGKELIEDYQEALSYWVSEPDKGVYNAMNKGIVKATGEYCIFMNSGDCFSSDTILEEAIKLGIDKDIVYCDTKNSYNQWTYPNELTMLYFFNKTLCHQATFIKRELFNQYGLYKENNKIVSDWQFFFEVIIIHSCSYKHLNLFLSVFELGGISTQPENNELRLKECHNVLIQYYPITLEEYLTYNESISELNFYKLSKPIQLIKKIQQSSWYKKLRK